MLLAVVDGPVLNIADHATGGRRTKDILGGPKGWGPKKKVANIEIYVIFEVFAFCGGRTKTDFKDRVSLPLPPPSVLLMKLCRDFMAYHPNAHTHTIQVQNERHRKGDESLINEPASQVVLAESARDNSNIWMYTGQWIRCMILTGWSF